MGCFMNVVAFYVTAPPCNAVRSCVRIPERKLTFCRPLFLVDRLIFVKPQIYMENSTLGFY
jgi:hypothetical protein